jgi:hypothetical protein
MLGLRHGIWTRMITIILVYTHTHTLTLTITRIITGTLIPISHSIFRFPIHTSGIIMIILITITGGILIIVPIIIGSGINRK